MFLKGFPIFLIFLFLGKVGKGLLLGILAFLQGLLRVPVLFKGPFGQKIDFWMPRNPFRSDKTGNFHRNYATTPSY